MHCKPSGIVRPRMGDVFLTPDEICWPHPEADYCLKSLDKVTSLKGWEIPSLKDKALELHLYRLKTTLLWWEQLPTEKLLSSKGIIYQNLRSGPNFADELDDAIKYGMRLASSVSLLYGKEEYPPQCTDYKDMDSLFSPYHLIPFRRPASGDIDYLFKEAPKIDQRLIDDFRNIILEHVKDSPFPKRVLDDVDRLNLLGSSTIYDPFNNKRIPKTEASLNLKEIPLTNRFKYDFVSVTKAPHESRECVVADLPTLATTKLVELQLQQVISCEWDAIREKDFSYLPEYLTYYNKFLYIMSDQKKCGLTFPRELLITLYEVLQERFPSYDFNLAVEGFRNSFIHKGDTVSKMVGGPGLGQFNVSISLIMSLLFELWRRDQDSSLHLDGKFYNDDQVIRFKYTEGYYEPLPDWANDLALSWDEFMESYSLQIHKKKPFISKAGVFLEVYGDGFPITVTKKTQKLGNLFHTLTAPTIFEAKKLFSSIFDSLEIDDQITASHLLKSVIIPFWGFEFTPLEDRLPIQLGGWVRHTNEEGLDDLFNSLSLIPTNEDSLINLLFLDYSPNTGHSKKKAVNQSISKIKKSLPVDNESFLPPAYNYNRLVRTGLTSFRKTTNQTFKDCYTDLKKRELAYKSRPRHVRDFSKLYWKFVLEDGKAYVPPQFATLEIECFLSQEENKCKGKSPDIPIDLLRICTLIQQQNRTINPWLEIYNPLGNKDVNSLFYLLMSKFENSKYSLTPNIVNLLMILGEDNLDKIINHFVKRYGTFKIPKPPHNILETLGFCDSSQLDNIIYLNHNGNFCYLTNTHADFDVDITRIESQMREDIENYILDHGDTYSYLLGHLNLESLENILKFEVYHRRHTSHREDNDPNQVHVTEEDRRLIEYLVYQIRAFSHRFPEEEVIRNLNQDTDLGQSVNLWGQTQLSDQESDPDGPIGFGDDMDEDY